MEVNKPAKEDEKDKKEEAPYQNVQDSIPYARRS
jgi:hypothetical protein